MNIHSAKKGFTLVEMIVSLGIFAMVALIAVGAFLKIIDANKKAQSLKTAVNNLNFAMESMTRELRVGSKYYCSNASATVSPNYTSNSCTELELIAFRSSKKGTGVSIPTCNLIYAYRYNSSMKTIEKAEQSDCDSSVPSVTSPFIPLVATNLNVGYLKFSMSQFRAGTLVVNKIIHTAKVTGANAGWVRIVAKASAGAANRDKVDFTLESFVSQRLLQ